MQPSEIQAVLCRLQVCTRELQGSGRPDLQVNFRRVGQIAVTVTDYSADRTQHSNHAMDKTPSGSDLLLLPMLPSPCCRKLEP